MVGLEKLKLSKKWVPRYEEEERIRKVALKLGKKEGKKEGRKEGKRVGIEAGIKKVAKKMIKDGEPIKKITKYTGLTKEEIENL